MTKAHKHAEVIKAWADGNAIQWQTIRNEWVDFDKYAHPGPWGDSANKWRIKPEPKKGWVRVAEHNNIGSPYELHWRECDNRTENEIESLDDFIRWLSPRLDFDYPEDYEGGA